MRQCPGTHLLSKGSPPPHPRALAMQTSSEQAPLPSRHGFEGRERSQGPATTTELWDLGEEPVLHHTTVSSSQKLDHSFIHSIHAYASTYCVPGSMLDREFKDVQGTRVQQRSQHIISCNATQEERVRGHRDPEGTRIWVGPEEVPTVKKGPRGCQDLMGS